MKTIKRHKAIISVVLGYFNALISNDNETAMACCCKSWQNDTDAKWMRAYLRMFNDLVDVSVVEVKYKHDNFAVVTVLTDNAIEEREYCVNVLRECAPYELSDNGQWGVVPTSLRML